MPADPKKTDQIESQEPPEPGPQDAIELDDEMLDVFLPDGQEDPLPERGDFWLD